MRPNWGHHRLAKEKQKGIGIWEKVGTFGRRGRENDQNSGECVYGWERIGPIRRQIEACYRSWPRTRGSTSELIRWASRIEGRGWRRSEERVPWRRWTMTCKRAWCRAIDPRRWVERGCWWGTRESTRSNLTRFHLALFQFSFSNTPSSSSFWMLCSDSDWILDSKSPSGITKYNYLEK